jgi:hypothetical protein
MHSFPPASELQFLVGKQLELISLGAWQFHFTFGKGSISVEDDLEYIDSEGVVHRQNTEADRFSPIYVHRLLGQKITHISVEPFCLSLTFDRGDLLRIYSNVGPYECGQIYDEADKLTVF